MKELHLYKFLLFVFFISFTTIIGQDRITNLFSQENILKFADHLYSEKDYLRAIMEYRRYLSLNQDDNLSLRIAEGYLRMNKFDESGSEFMKLFNSSVREEAILGYARSQFLSGNFKPFSESGELSGSESWQVLKLKYLTYLYTGRSLPAKEEMLEYFPETSRSSIERFYERKRNPERKSELKAAILSAIIPGTGKIYSGNYGDGITAFIVTSLLGYITYDNFNAGNTTKGWIFAGLSSIFYAGNIYGSAAAVQIHNRGVELRYVQDLDYFLQKNNYFLGGD